MSVDDLINQIQELLKTGSYTEAVKRLRQAQADGQADADLDALLGIALEESGDLKGAVASYRKAIDKSPDDIDAHYALADILFEQNSFDEALALYKKISTTFSDQAEAEISMGLVHFSQEQIEEAILCYEQGLKIDPKSIFGLNALGDALLAKGDMEKAVETFKRVIVLDPEDAQAYFNLAEIHYDLVVDEAETCCQEAIKRDPGFSYAYLTLGNLYLDRDDIGEALQAFQEFLTLENSPAAEDIRFEVAAVVDGLKAELGS